jgi:predicted DNA binding CopG/RHH family protein
MGQCTNIGVLRIMLKGKGNTVQTASINWDAMINAPQKREAAPMVSVRIPQALIDASKAEAGKRGIPYSVLFREALVKLLREET